MNVQPLKDIHREQRIFRLRVVIASFFVFLMILVLIARMVYLQVFNHDTYKTLSEKNRVAVEAVPPTRGLIYDRHGTLLADNQPSFAVSIVKERVEDLDHTLQEIRALIDVSDDDIRSFKRRMQQRHRPYAPIPLRFHLNEEEIAKIAVNQHELNGVSVEARLIRHYPQRELLAHAIGYVGRINEKEQQRLDESRYAGTHYIGKVGLEYAYENRLHGEVGMQRIETNARGRVMRVIEREDPIPGENLQLYLDLKTQKAATDALDGRRGAIVALEIDTGGVVAFVSKPMYDPNLFVTGIPHSIYEKLRDSKARPLFNRVLRGQYPPGSTVKPMIGLAGLEHDIVSWDTRIWDPGWYQLEGEEHLYRDWKREGHGRVDMDIAVVQSCDTYFYDMTFKLGIDRLHDFMIQFGLGQATGIDLVGEKRGLMPSSRWKRQNRNLPWFPGETLITGIGQGFMLATPMQLARLTAIYATEGYDVVPKMVKQGPPPTPQRAVQLSDPNDWTLMNRSMERAVHSARGTARRIADGMNYRMGGKTGTAQVVAIAQDEEYDEEALSVWHRDHALFVGYAPAEAPRIAVAVIVENGGSGGATAAPVARKVIDAYFEHNPLPEDLAVSIDLDNDHE